MTVLGDFNAKARNDNHTINIIMRKEGLDTMNKNGKLFTDFCEQNDSPDKMIWSSPNSWTGNQIDHFTISHRWQRSQQYVRVYGGVDIGSDHTLVIGKLKTRIQSIRKSGLQGFNISKLKTPAQQKEFSLLLSKRFHNKGDKYLWKNRLWQVWHSILSWPRDSSETFQNLAGKSNRFQVNKWEQV